jgi:hypothetical protein
MEHSVKRPLFVLSAGRSGSNMLGQVLNLAPGVTSTHEPLPHLLDVNFRVWAGRATDHDVEAALAVRRDSLIAKAAQNGLAYVESSTYLSFLVSQLKDRYDAKFIHLVRDAREFVASGLARGWYKWPLPVRWLRLQLGSRATRSLQSSLEWECHRLWPPDGARSRAAQVAWLWQEYNLGIDRRLREAGAESLRMKLEDFERDAKSALQGVLAFAGIDASARLDEMVSVAQRRPNRRRGKQKTLQWTPADEDALNQWAGSARAHFGYTSD